jgi:hypothetical protein
MGKPSKRSGPCKRAEDCCLYKPCQRNKLKKKKKDKKK